MIHGKVGPDLDAVVRLRVLGPQRDDAQVEAVVDTGFDGALTLPPQVIAILSLPLVDEQMAILGDGSITSFSVYLAQVEWDGTLREVRTYASASGALIGMALLQEHELKIRVRAGDAVTIVPL